MYTVSGYGDMMADRVRMSAYREALRRAIKPGAVVLDIGTGTGIFAMLALRFGARKVYAVEPEDAIEVARKIAAANGCAQQIEFFQDYSTRINLPERADLIISDMRGVLPLFQKHLPSIIDARARLLAPGGTLIPERDELWAAVVESPKFYQEKIKFWEAHGFELDLGAARPYVVNSWQRAIHSPDQLLTKPACWAVIDYTSIESADVRGEATCSAERKGTAHGLAVWFTARLYDDVSFSNAPGEAELIYGQAFFPLREPVELDEGDNVSVMLYADLVNEDYIWRWETVVLDHAHAEKARFKQSSFFATPLSPAQLRKRASNYAPALNRDGQIDGLILSMMNGKLPLGEIARHVAERFPERFASWQAALNRVGELSRKYGCE